VNTNLTAGVPPSGSRGHQPGRLRGADPAADHHRHQDRPDLVHQPARPRLRLPVDGNGLAAPSNM